MVEVRFITRQDGNTIHVCNKNAQDYIGYITLEDDRYLVPGEEKKYTSRSDAISRLIEIKVRGEN